MRLSLHQRLAPPGNLDIWVGATQTAQAPQIQWLIDGAPAAAPTVMRPLSVIRGPQLAGKPERTFTGLVRFADPDPAKFHRIDAIAGNVRTSVIARSIRRAVPAFGTPDKLRLLLVSCYHRTPDKGDVATHAVHNVLKTKRPDLTLFLGDQVYLDLPTLQNFDTDLAWLAENFESKYVANWFPVNAAMDAGFHAILRSAPAVFAPDDHEYWNNYPHAAPLLENTWHAQETWERAARMMWNVFQLHHGAQPGDPVRIDFFDPLSILMIDTRTRRERDFSRAMSPGAPQVLAQWADHVINNKKFGVLVTGQSLFEKEKNWLSQRAIDSVLADHKDYPLLANAVRKILGARRSLLCITGDVHWGRVLTVRNSLHANRLYEVISSPVSLVENLWTDLGQGVGGLFGRRPSGPWPKHSDPPRDVFGLPAFPGFEFATPEANKGNQVVLLEIASIGGTRLNVEATFHPLNPTIRPKTFRFDLH